MRNINIIQYRDFKIKTLVSGFRGIGQVGYFTIKYLIDKLNMERVAIIDTPYMQPVVVVEDHYLSYPIEIYRLNDLGVLKIEDIPTNRVGAILIHNILKLIKERGLKRMILIGGLVSSLREGDEYARIVTNSYWGEESRLRYSHRDVRILGPLAYALTYSEILQIPTLAILAYADSEKPVDAMGIYYAVETLKNFIELTIDTSDLINMAKEIEERIREVTKEMEDEAKKYKYYT